MNWLLECRCYPVWAVFAYSISNGVFAALVSRGVFWWLHRRRP